MLQHLQVQAAAKTEDPQTIIGRGTEVNLGGQVIKYPDLDFTIKAGEKVLLTGPSGCGKSSLFKLLLGQIEPSKGQLTYLDSEGKEIQNPARSFEYLPQAGWIFPGTVADNITMYDAKKQTKLAEVLKKVGLDRDFSKAVDLDREVSPQQADLSGGQKQKVVLARAEVRDSQLLLVDEGTSAIDQAAGRKILDKLLQSKQTVVLIAHNLTKEERDLFDREVALRA
ncbi:ATP-binding cassette domain-containing protein [Lactobacillus delbrueckii subsp. bulgaricus]|nr:ATP-binding cassette domain-containing protein [Lactobacillus delbrueckii subsp. bulgaricus]MCT3471592.1 ATP-binding cassette domain-containing protein [Lactobacillus delbrueckii subsp. bulgaricus]